MNIILVSGNLAKARTYTLSPSRMAVLLTGLVLIVLVAAAVLNYLVLRHAAESKSPLLQSVLLTLQEREQERTQSYLRENLNAMAVRLGQMQAQLLRLDSLGERLAKLSGLKPQDFLFDRIPGQGGAASALLPSQDLSLGEFNRRIEDLNRLMNDRTDKLGVLESYVMQDRLTKKMLPSVLPIVGGAYSSNYGWRIDPFTGSNAFHEGVDFMAETGTAIVAAAGGVVVYSDYHPEYGNMLEIDHGNGLITRYAHGSKRIAKVGDVVLRGQKIGEVGSTGRSTGSHLHFEVRNNGTPLNPGRFLQPAG
ncbi:MAG: M23 family metallopeptidase [Betaproteobacteria bacterium]|nr:M23 family metallopeptidase [Betaproteobacteria bacterium]